MGAKTLLGEIIGPQCHNKSCSAFFDVFSLIFSIVFAHTHCVCLWSGLGDRSTVHRRKRPICGRLSLPSLALNARRQTLISPPPLGRADWKCLRERLLDVCMSLSPQHCICCCCCSQSCGAFSLFSKPGNYRLKQAVCYLHTQTHTSHRAFDA